jgi:hypothetical protein
MNMLETRRNFVWALAAMGGLVMAVNGRGLAQRPTQRMPSPPSPADPQEQDKKEAAGTPDSQVAKRMQLLENEKEFRAGVARLYQLSSELQDELQKTPTQDVLSIRMYKKMEEIEKLAKQLKNRAKG